MIMNYLATYDTDTLLEMLHRHREQYLVMKQSGSNEQEKWKVKMDRLADEIKRRTDKEVSSSAARGKE